MPPELGNKGYRGRGIGRRIGKRGTLREVSSSGRYDINVSNVDLSQLISGKHFTIPCTVSRNGYAIQTTALADSGVNGFVFINTRFTRELMKFLDVPPTTLPTPCPVKGYDGKLGKPVTQILTLHLGVDGRR